MAKTTQRRQKTVAESTPAVTEPALLPLGLLLAVAVISAATMAYEVALTRVFSVLLRYHFAFLIISVALCGLGVGGFLAHALRRKRPLSLSLLATGFGLGILVSLLLILRVIFAYVPDAYWLAAVLLLIPFTCAGAYLAEVFARYAPWSGKLYAWDLLGAALAAVGVIGLLQVVSAINACLLLTVLTSAAGLLSSASKPKPAQYIWPAVFIFIFFVNIGQPIFDIPPIPPRVVEGEVITDSGITQPLFSELGQPGGRTHIVTTRWNAFARTDVVAETDSPSIEPDVYLIYTNGNVPTNMLKWDGSTEALPEMVANYTLCDYTFASAPLGRDGAPRGTVLSIGPGGGLDALLALRYGAAKFEGAELNPSIVSLMETFRSYNGGIYRRPEVRVVTAEGRAYVRERAAQGQRYALIFSALTKTATAGQGMALLESYIHTQDALADYLGALQDDGQLVWLVDNPSLLARFYATAIATLEAQGLSVAEACGHIAMLQDPKPGPYSFALIVQKSPFTTGQTAAMAERATAQSLKTLWLPGQGGMRLYQQMAAGKGTLAEYLDFYRYPERYGEALKDVEPTDVSPCTDDQPFVLDVLPGILPVFQQLTLFALVLGLAVVGFGWRAGHGQKVTGEDFTFILYFLALGVGFMLVEIPLIQKLILPLGYPTLALAVILFSLLLGGGVGSAVSQRFTGRSLRRLALFATLGVALFTVAYSVLLNGLPDALVGVSLPVRCLLVAALLLPLGFLLGTPFPSGMRLFAGEGAAQVPLVWGLNGVASVVGSLCAAMAAKLIGFSAVMLLGAASYIVAMGLLALTKRR